MITRSMASALFVFIVLTGCDEPPTEKPLPTFPEADAGGHAGDAEASDDGEVAPPARVGPQYGVINGDWSATSVSLLGREGELLADNYINSGSVRAGLVTALSGDVELPTRSGDPGVLVLIDRYKTDVITRIRLSDATILGQVKTHTPPSQGTENAFTSNPQDYVRIDETTAWVTRNHPNLDPGVPELERGNDLLRINPSTMTRTDERIDLSALNTTATRTNPDTGAEEQVDVYARPVRMARLGDTLIVGLDRSAFDFSAFGSGMVAVVNLESREVQGLTIDGLSSCSQVTPVPDSEEHVLVGCRGLSGQTRETAGVAIVRVATGAASIEHIFRAQDHADAPALSGPFVAISTTLVAGASNQYAGDIPSVFGTVDLTTSVFTELLTMPAGQGAFGTPLYDREQGLLLVPDSSVDSDKRPTRGVHVLFGGPDGFREDSVLPVATETTMPVRHVFPL